MNSGQVVITGLGAISPLGIGADTMWAGLLEGKCGIERIKAFDPAGFTCQIAGETPEFKIRKHVPKSHRKAIKLELPCLNPADRAARRHRRLRHAVDDAINHQHVKQLDRVVDPVLKNPDHQDAFV